MRVKCKWSKGDVLATPYVDSRIPRDNTTDWFLTTGKEYVVYAMQCCEGKTWYYIMDDHDLWFPIMKPAPLFEIVDSRLSSAWRVAFEHGRDYKTGKYSIEIILLAFDEWCSDPTYYERLSDNNAHEVAIFAQRRKEMDSE